MARLREQAQGHLLDIGCGDMPYRAVIGHQVEAYDGLDIEPRSVAVRYTGSVTDMNQVPDASYDTVLCTEVLEHVPSPTEAAHEMARVLRPGGTVILTVPFLGRLHEEPWDFFRYTRFGLTQLFEEAGFEIVEISEHGSVASFLGHQVSTGLVGLTWHIPIVKWIAFMLNSLVVVVPAAVIDSMIRPLWSKLPLGYVMVARRLEGVSDGSGS